MAGTTIDEGGAVYAVLRQSVEEATGRTVSDALLSAWVGTSKLLAIRGLLSGLGEDEGRADGIFAGFSDRLMAAYEAEPPTLLPGVKEAVAALRSDGVAVGLQTGYTREVAEALLQTVGWRVGDDVDALLTADEVPASRPAPYLVFGTMAATGVEDVAEVAVAGDTANDLLAGSRSGARFVVGVLTGAHTVAELGAERHTHLLPSVVDLPDLLASG